MAPSPKRSRTASAADINGPHCGAGSKPSCRTGAPATSPDAARAAAIEPSAMRDLMTRYGAQLTTVLKGKHLLVGGRARPVQIAFTENGRPTGKYYFQTHVVVTHANQIEVVGE